MWALPLVAALLCLLHPSSLALTLPVAPCSACKAIASELQSRIDNEPTRNHLDMRNRLDEKGQRYGKVISYKASELRAVELLDDLCSTMRKWTLVSVNSTDGTKTRHWERVSDAAAPSRPPSDEEEVRQKQLTSFCGRVLEEHDEDMTDGLRQGDMEEQGVEKWLCHKLLRTCPVGSKGPSATNNEPESQEGVTSQQAQQAADAAAAAEAAAAGDQAAAAGTGQDAGTQPKAEL